MISISNKAMLIFIISTCLASTVFTQEKTMKFLEDVYEEIEAGVEHIYEQITEPLKYNIDKSVLTGGAIPGTITVEESNCLKDSIFTNAKVRVKPEAIPKGGKSDIKVRGQSSKDINIKHLNIVCYLNNEKAYEMNSDKVEPKASSGQNYDYSYSAGIPTFVPEGHYDITLSLVDDTDTKVSCMKLSFDF